MAKINVKTFKKALKNSGGNQARIAEKLEVTRQAVGLFLNKNPKMRDLLDHEAEHVLDIAEDNINTDIMVHGSIESSKWKLTNSKRGKQRGYGPTQETIHSGGLQVDSAENMRKIWEDTKEKDEGQIEDTWDKGEDEPGTNPQGSD